MNATEQSVPAQSKNSHSITHRINWLSRRLYRANVTQIRIQLPGKEPVNIGVPGMAMPTPVVTIVNPLSLLKTSAGGLLGWAEAYIAGHWQTDNLRQLIAWAMHNEEALEKAFTASWLSRKINRAFHLLHNNSKRGSKRNIAAHYDLGNDFYQQWLDPTMTYSGALFETSEDSLEQAQKNKYQQIIEMLELSDHHSVLEIGCGWGGFARTLAEHGTNPYLGVSLSKEQLSYARTATSDKQQLQYEFRDYRDLDGQYDRIVSIEMFEAVGESHWPEYFQKVYDSLVPGGIAVLQVITIADERFASYRKEADFIQRYIFPGGMLPSHSVIQEQIYRSSLQLKKSMAFGKNYAKTLAIWCENFNKAWPEIASDKFDDQFHRMWNYYLAYCEAGFLHDSIDVRFYKLQK